MLDFIHMTVDQKQNYTIVYPAFKIKPSKDLMTRGKDFYAVWDYRIGLWSKSENTALELIDIETENFVKEHQSSLPKNTIIRYAWNSKSKITDDFHHYVQKQMRDNYNELDTKVVFKNQEIKKDDYVTKVLPYSIGPGNLDGYNLLMDTIFEPKEREKLEWAIGSIIKGDSKKLQKFIVLYGGPGTGKSTFLECVLQSLFEGYYSMFEAKSLASRNNQFALEAFKSNPLIAIQHDGDLSMIADNTKLNSIVSHEKMIINEKFKSQYETKIQSFLFMGTNEPVYITGSKSGLLRRLIDVQPSGRRLNPMDYDRVKDQLVFEKGAIADHCLEVYETLGFHFYDHYEPKEMKVETDDFYNFIEEYYFVEMKNGEIDYAILKSVFEAYKNYCERTLIKYPYSYKRVRAELKDYFNEYQERFTLDTGERVRNYYSGFKKEKLNGSISQIEKLSEKMIEFKEQTSIFDYECCDMPAQYANNDGIPKNRWDKVTTTLKDLNTKELHYVKLPENHIVIDFDLKNENGEKDYNLNLKAASKFPKTYAELSKSGAGIHLHYIYDGDVSELERIYADDIEIKVFTGNSSLRRKLTYCNDEPINVINSGLPLKEKKGENMLNFDGFKSEKALRSAIEKCLNKEHHGATKPEIDFIYKHLEDAYNSGLKYDISDMRPIILAFANNSTNQADACVKLVSKMKWKSDEPSYNVEEIEDDSPLIFFDIEIFPNLFLINWKKQGENQHMVRMINPTSSEVKTFVKGGKLVGFNNRRYDNHMLYAAMMGYSIYELFLLSQKIISGSKNAMFGEAYNLSYTDVYDFASSYNKMSLKKWEIKLGIHHQELGLPWDQPVPQEKWREVAAYCDNDVYSTEAVFNHLQGDWYARQLLAKLSGLTVNDTTNAHSTRIMFGDDKNPQKEFIYTDLSKEFPGYKFENGKSYYRGEEVSEGGYVYAEPGMYEETPVLDIASMHPSTIEVLQLFGPKYTKRFSDLKNARLAIKHNDREALKDLLDGALIPALKDIDDGKYTEKDLANALKTVINSVYGLTFAKFDNKFRDPRNVDNIVAKRGALFMVDLKHEVQKRGFTVAHIKTDSIKIPNATPEIIQFVMDFGKKYGYTFEHETTYHKMCLVNDAVYIAKEDDGWTATGAEFAVPYIFKTLFSKEEIEFKDYWETKSVSTAIYLDMNERLPDVSIYEKEKETRDKIKRNVKNPPKPNPELAWLSDDELDEEIAKGHHYVFIGRVGAFCPVKEGCGGGNLVRIKDGKYYSVSGSKGYRWMEAEMIQTLDRYDNIDMEYYDNQINEAINHISEFGDFEWLVEN